MEYLKRVSDAVRAGLITFVNIVTLANRDYPYHDFHHVDEESTSSGYVVGSNNIAAHGSQRKLFVSKSTLIMATENSTIVFNHDSNVVITLLADTWYEFKSNIYHVFCACASQEFDIYLYFEGVLPQEQRGPE